MCDFTVKDNEAFISRVTQEEVKEVHDRIVDYMRNTFGMNSDVSDVNSRMAYTTLVKYTQTTNELALLSNGNDLSQAEIKRLMLSVLRKFEMLAKNPVAFPEFQWKVSEFANATLKKKLESISAAQKAERDRVASMQKAERDRLVKAALERKKKAAEQAASERKREEEILRLEQELDAKNAAEAQRRKEQELRDKENKAAAAEERRRIKDAEALAAKRAMEEARKAKKMARRVRRTG
jgi:hypothetical protein